MKRVLPVLFFISIYIITVPMLCAFSGKQENRNANEEFYRDKTQAAALYRHSSTNQKLSAVTQQETDLWKNPGPSGDTIYVITAAPNDHSLYAGTNHGVYKSTDGGANWKAINNGLPLNAVNSLIISPDNTSILYTCLEGSGVYKSINGGSDWFPVNNGLTNLRVVTMAMSSMDSNTLYVGTTLFGSTPSVSSDSPGLIPGGVYKTSDGGMSWHKLNLDFDIRSLAINPLDNNIVYAGTSGQGIYKSTDGGVGWRASNSGLEYIGSASIIAFKIDPKNPNILYAMNADSPYKSTDGGSSWVKINSGLGSGSVFAMAIDPLDSNLIYCGLVQFGGGIYKSTNGGATWTSLTLLDFNVLSLEIDRNNRNVIFAGTTAGVYKTVNAGLN